MSDLFSLAPEGQVWADNQAAAKPAQPDDYDPRWYAGNGSALFRGAAEGSIGLLQTGVEAAKLSPTYSSLRGIVPDLDEVVDKNLPRFRNRSTMRVRPSNQRQTARVSRLISLKVWAASLQPLLQLLRPVR
ncbi:hypothetical protein [Pantoea sp. JZ2]|uniref:hypothetical protein n=1 Tax=Pantoea sp. JZ2 TaxID=2654189 RepID=UPI002B4805C4|nr:hypothetical protein [Pantoea sp. JZ2]